MTTWVLPLLVSLLPPTAPEAGTLKHTVVVAPFAARGVPVWMAEGFSHALSTYFYDVPGWGVFSVRQAAHVLLAHARDKSLVIPQTLAAELGADVVVSGTLSKKAPHPEGAETVTGQASGKGVVYLEVVLSNAAGPLGAPLLFANFDASDPYPLENALAAAVFKRLETPLPSQGPSLTTHAEAWLHFFEGLALLAGQSLSPKAADRSVAPALSTSQINKAQDLFEKSLTDEPTLAAAHAGLAIVFALRGDSAAARSHAESGATARGPLPVVSAAFVHMREGDYDAAVRGLQGAVTANRGFLHARGSLGQLYHYLGRFREARAVFADYVEDVPRQPWARVQLGYALARTRRFDEAIAVTQAGLDLAPNSNEFKLELASRYIDAGRFAEAQVLLAQLVAAKGSQPQTAIRLGYVHLMLNQNKETIVVTEKALRILDPESAPKDAAYAHLNLARAWGRMGQLDVALAQIALARKTGQVDCSEITTDPGLDKLRNDPRYLRLKCDGS